ncbi:MAG: hypothetical protein R2725_13060 [Solirubrobacterales bacterium]
MSFAQSAALRGFLGATLTALAGALALLPLVDATDLSPSAELLRGLAQVGATLLVAYAVEAAWLPTASTGRGASRGSWLGYAAGIGVALALGLAEADTGSLSLIGQLGLAWVLFSLPLLGLLVVLLPLLLYEWADAARTENPDELT